MTKIGFDNETYLQLQSKKILERVDRFGGKLYLEFGGKLFDDYHASRVLPGFEPDSKMRMLLQLKDRGGDRHRDLRGRHRAEQDAAAISASRYDDGRPAPDRRVPRTSASTSAPSSSRSTPDSTRPTRFQHTAGGARREGLPATIPSTGYPSNVGADRLATTGFGKNDYIETTRARRRRDGPRPRQRQDGDLPQRSSTTSTSAASQAGYAKYETFPVWNLPLKHPVNLAYEAATADLERRQHDRPLPPRGLRRDDRQLQPRRGDLPGARGDVPSRSTANARTSRPTDMGVNMVGLRHRRRRGLPRGVEAGDHPPLFRDGLQREKGPRRGE